MAQPQLKVAITFTRPSKWAWAVSLDGRHVGTVTGDISCGFIARDLGHRCLGIGYASAKSAMEAFVPPADSDPS